MSHRPKPQRKRRGPGRALLRFHRRVGLALSAVFILVCLTGILLNHNDDFRLQKRTIDAAWVYDWYDREPEGELVHYALLAASVSMLEGQLYVNGKTARTYDQPLVGVAQLEGSVAIAFESFIALATLDGDIIETLTPESLPGTTINAIASEDRRTLMIDTDNGSYRSDPSILTWESTDRLAAPHQLSASDPSPELRAQLLRSYRGEAITWGRVLLDLHTGRFFGPIGKWIADLSALALIFLTVTGVIYTLRYLNKARDRANRPTR